MRVVKRTALYNVTIEDDAGNKLELKRGSEYTTSLVGHAPMIGPKPVEGRVVVFSTYWVPVPVEMFEPLKEGEPEELQHTFF